jgi:hypothetical protein
MVFDEGRGLSDAKQQYDPNPIINELRQRVDQWRALPNPAQWLVTPETVRLLQHWRHHKFSNARPFFCQVEAVETAIWLTRAPQPPPPRALCAAAPFPRNALSPARARARSASCAKGQAPALLPDVARHLLVGQLHCTGSGLYWRNFGSIAASNTSGSMPRSRNAARTSSSVSYPRRGAHRKSSSSKLIFSSVRPDARSSASACSKLSYSTFTRCSVLALTFSGNIRPS